MPAVMPVLRKPITFFGRSRAIICDGKCHKAWGTNNRPRLSLSADPDDYVFLADDECGAAPIDPGTYEGGHAKPLVGTIEAMNKWCARECERSVIADRNEIPRLPGFSRRRYDMPLSDPEQSR